MTCIICPNGCGLHVDRDGGKWIVKGNLCIKGRDFAIKEMTNPTRSICSTVKTSYPCMPRLPVRTDGEVPLNLIPDIMKAINAVMLDHPVHIWDVIIENVCGTGVDVISTSDIYELLDDFPQK